MSEHQEQVALINWSQLNEWRFPELGLLHAIPNGGKRTINVARKLKAEGVKPGVPDLCLPVRRGETSGLYIEMKADGGRVTKEQSAWLQALTAQGFRAVVCFGWDMARDTIIDYLQSEE